MTQTDKISYSQLTRWAPECLERFGKIHKLPIVKSYHSECARIYTGGEVLDVGAGAFKPLKKILAIEEKDYFSLDNDPGGIFNYVSFADIPGEKKFHLIIMNQVLEHLRIDDAFLFLRESGVHLLSGGHAIISIPNAHHPVRFWGDATHATAWPYEHLYGLIRHSGLCVEKIARYNKFPLTRNPLKRFIIHTVCNTFRMDWCDSMLFIARLEKG